MSAKLRYEYVKTRDVPGSLLMVVKEGKKPFMPPMRECNSIPLHYSDRVIDIGAYMGQYSIRCARFPVKRVIAYEPTPLSYEILTKTKLPNFIPINAAIVGNNEKNTILHISSGFGVTNSTTLSYRTARSIMVPAINYIDAIKDATIVKIDVEGGEYSFHIEDNFPDSLRGLIIDFHPVTNYNWLKKAKEIIIEIEKNGFQPVISPDWSSGWTRAGSWIRDRDLPDITNPMLEGKICCGCGKIINSFGKSLCIDCWNRWSIRHRRGYKLAR